MKRQETAGHPGFTREPYGLVREPERLLAQLDHAPLARHAVELARTDPDEDQDDRGQSDQPRSDRR